MFSFCDYLLQHLPKDRHNVNQPTVSQILLIVLLEDRSDVCFLRTLPHPLNCYELSKIIWEWSHNYIDQDPQHLYVRPIRSRVLVYVQSIKMFSNLMLFHQE